MLGDKIKDLREQKGLGVNELARKAKMNASYISAIERNEKTNPSTKILNKLADALDVSVDEFFKEIQDSLVKEMEAIYAPDKVSNAKKIESNLDVVPEQFTCPEEARAYISKHQMFAAEGFNINEMSDRDVMEFGNALLEQMKMVGYKYKK